MLRMGQQLSLELKKNLLYMFLNLYFEAQCTPEFNCHTGKKGFRLIWRIKVQIKILL